MRISGIIKDIKDAQPISDKLTKRELWIETPDEKYPQTLSIEFINAMCPVLDNYSIGQEVFIEINLKGRIYRNQQTAIERCYNTIQGWKIEEVPQAKTDKMVRQQDIGNSYNQPGGGDDLPF